ncbi:MAG TPA: hypothetical protein VKR53_00980 [Puia sp.]|nr:hypothetical protein [Puia sp.]
MAKLHTHYITNAQKELKYAYAGVSEGDFQSSIRDALAEANGSDDLYEDEGDYFFDDDDDENDDDGNGDDDGTEIEKWVDINDLELNRLLNIEVSVVIDPQPLPVINHGSNLFDIEATVDRILGSTT